MGSRRIVIKNSVITGFADEVSFEGHDVENIQKQRVSHIIPKPILKSIIFKIMRSIFPEKGRVSEWTRGWSCKWLVIIDKEQFGPFVNRDDAIYFEKQKIYEQGKLFN